MAMTVGCLTTIASRVIRRFDKTFVRETIEQDWYLHPTKGWRRGAKRKRKESIGLRNLYPFWTFKKIWKSYQ